MTASVPKQAAWLFLILLAALFVLGAQALAQDAACIANNRAFGGATAKCAREICTWQACVDNIMLQGQLNNIPLQNKDAMKAQSERDSALATCKPHEQVMNQCLAAAVPPRPAAWCSTGRDRDKERIEKAGFALKTRFDALMADYEPRRAAYEKRHDVWQPQWAALEAEAKAYSADQRSLSKEALHAKWEASGRRARSRIQIKPLQAERDWLRVEYEALNKMDAIRLPLRQKLKDLQAAWNARDCARAAAILGLN